jgi:hypothetical protein
MLFQIMAVASPSLWKVLIIAGGAVFDTLSLARDDVVTRKSFTTACPKSHHPKTLSNC